MGCTGRGQRSSRAYPPPISHRNARRNTGKRNFVMAGVTTDICMVSPSISAHEEGYNVKVVCDACGSSNQIAEEMAWRRGERPRHAPFPFPSTPRTRRRRDR
jgi:nicotinamidase-related amidase